MFVHIRLQFLNTIIKKKTKKKTGHLLLWLLWLMWLHFAHYVTMCI